MRHRKRLGLPMQRQHNHHRQRSSSGGGGSRNTNALMRWPADAGALGNQRPSSRRSSASNQHEQPPHKVAGRVLDGLGQQLLACKRFQHARKALLPVMHSWSQLAPCHAWDLHGIDSRSAAWARQKRICERQRSVVAMWHMRSVYC